MKIAIFALLMVIVLTLVESYSNGDGSRGIVGSRGEEGSGDYWHGRRRNISRIDTVDGMRLKGNLNNKLVQRDLGNGQRRYIRDVNKKQHVHMSFERLPPSRVQRNAQTLKNVHERAFAETEDAGK